MYCVSISKKFFFFNNFLLKYKFLAPIGQLGAPMGELVAPMGQRRTVKGPMGVPKSH